MRAEDGKLQSYLEWPKVMTLYIFPPHVILVIGCKITSVNGIYEVIGSNAIITFSADHVPVHDKIKFCCKLDHKGYEPCK